MATKLKSDFREPAITSAPDISATPTEAGGSGIARDLANLANAFVSSREAKERENRKNFETLNQLNITTAVGSFKNKYGDNPPVQKEMGLRWINGYVSDFSESDKAITIARFNSLFNVTLEDSNKVLVEKTRARSLANQNQLAVQKSAITKSVGKNTFSPHPGTRAAAEIEINSLRSDLMRQLSEHRIDSFGKAFSLFPPDVASVIVQEFNDTFLGEGLIEWGKQFRSTSEGYLALLDGGPEIVLPGKETAEGGIEEGIVVKGMNAISKGKRKEVLQFFKNKLTIEKEVRTSAEAIASKKEKLKWANNGAALIENLLTAPPELRVDPEKIGDMGKSNDIDPSKLEDYIALAVKPRPEFDNAELVKSFEFALDAGVVITELLADPLISAQFKSGTFKSMSAQNTTNINVAAGIDEGPLKSEVNRGLALLKSSIQTGGVGGTLGMVFQVDNKAVLRRLEAVKLYQLRTAPVVDPETGRVSPPLENPTDVATDLIKRSLTDFMTTGIGGDLLLPSGFKGTRKAMTSKGLNAGMTELQRRFDAGVINKKIYDRNSILYAKWYGYLPEIVNSRVEDVKEKKPTLKRNR